MAVSLLRGFVTLLEQLVSILVLNMVELLGIKRDGTGAPRVKRNREL